MSPQLRFFFSGVIAFIETKIGSQNDKTVLKIRNWTSVQTFCVLQRTLQFGVQAPRVHWIPCVHYFFFFLNRRIYSPRERYGVQNYHSQYWHVTTEIDHSQMHSQSWRQILSELIDSWNKSWIPLALTYETWFIVFSIFSSCLWAAIQLRRTGRSAWKGGWTLWRSGRRYRLELTSWWATVRRTGSETGSSPDCASDARTSWRRFRRGYARCTTCTGTYMKVGIYVSLIFSMMMQLP